MAKLTDTAAKKMKAGGKPLGDGTVTGLRLIPGMKAGHGKWQLRFSSPETGKRRDMGLGQYPEVPIANARELAQQARALIAAGQDPIEVRERSRQAPSPAETPTFQDAATQVWEDLKPGWKNPKHAQQWINTLRDYAFPLIGNRAVDKLTPGDFGEVLRSIWLEKPETARRVRQRCHAVLQWCWAHGHISANPVDAATALLPSQATSAPKREHHPAMPWRAVPAFVSEHLSLGGNVSQDILLFTILTACRSGESRLMTWAELNLDERVWRIDGSRMKTGVTHRVPLSSQAVAILVKRRETDNHSKLVFPAPRGGALSDMALTKFLRDHRAPSDTAGRVATAHGFRSSFRDWASEGGYPRDLAERALAHSVRDQTERAYHRTDLLEKRRPMMQAWADHCAPEKS